MRKVSAFAILSLVICSGFSLADDQADITVPVPLPLSILKKTTPGTHQQAGFDEDILPVHLGKVVPVLPRETES